jgi:sodium-dependent dicarboxylate transporter 2/3/5
MPSTKDFLPYLLVFTLLALLGVAYGTGSLQTGMGLSRPEAIALVILLATAILWVAEIIPLYVTSLAVLFFQILWLLPAIEGAGLEATRNDFLIAFFSDITLLFMGGFVLAALMNKYRLSNMLARSILKRTGTKPASILLSIILVSSVFSMWMSNTATAAMMFAIIAPIVQGLPNTNSFSKALALSIPFACNVGGIGTPIGTPPNAIAMEYLQYAGINVSFTMWMVVATPLMLLLMLILWRVLLKLYPPGDIEINLETKPLDTLSKGQIAVIVLFFLTVLGWLTSGSTGVSVGMVGLFVVLVAFGGNLLTTRDFKNISWDILFMLGGGLCLGAGLSKSGLTDVIAGIIPMDNGFGFAFLVLLVLAAVMTTFMSNTATANLLIPVAVALPQGELILAIAIALMCSTSMALPISTPPNAIAFGSGLIQSREMLRSGILLTILAMIGIAITCFVYLPKLF